MCGTIEGVAVTRSGQRTRGGSSPRVAWYGVGDRVRSIGTQPPSRFWTRQSSGADEALEPLRSILEKKIPALIKVGAPAQIAALIKFMDEWETRYVLLEAKGAREHAETLAEKGIGVVVPKDVVRWEMHKPYHQADDLSRSGVMVAFQSHAEDAARTLPLVGLHAVERGLAADAALAAMTTQAAKMFMLDDVVGSLTPGRFGDLVIFSGHPFEAGSYVKRVIVQGEEVR